MVIERRSTRSRTLHCQYQTEIKKAKLINGLLVKKTQFLPHSINLGSIFLICYSLLLRSTSELLIRFVD
jgi:hypothetical protein